VGWLFGDEECGDEDFCVYGGLGFCADEDVEMVFLWWAGE
jgi:hypothetical protein